MVMDYVVTAQQGLTHFRHGEEKEDPYDSWEHNRFVHMLAPETYSRFCISCTTFYYSDIVKVNCFY